MDVPLRWIEDKRSTEAMLDHTHWSAAQSRVWVPTLFFGLLVLMASRISLPICMAEMAQDLQWDKRIQVGVVSNARIHTHHKNFHLFFFFFFSVLGAQGVVLSSFFAGYIFTQVIGGHLADRYGGDCVQWIAALVWSLATLSLAYVAHISVTLVLIARFVTGLAQGRLGWCWLVLRHVQCVLMVSITHTHIHTYTHTHIAHVHTLHTYTHTHIAHTHTYTRTHTARIHTLHTYTHCTHTHTAHIHTYTHCYTCRCTLSFSCKSP